MRSQCAAPASGPRANCRCADLPFVGQQCFDNPSNNHLYGACSGGWVSRRWVAGWVVGQAVGGWMGGWDRTAMWPQLYSLHLRSWQRTPVLGGTVPALQPQHWQAAKDSITIRWAAGDAAGRALQMSCHPVEQPLTEASL